MYCPRCNATDTRVIDSRMSKEGRSIRRRRLCTECEYRFTTLEEIVREDLFVRKRDGRREEFDRSKIIGGLRRACEKRPIDMEQIEMMIADVIVELETQFDYDIPTSEIGERIMTKLRDIDQVAYVRFASVYKDFRDASEFTAEIAGLTTPR